jgi:hypothetical protein
MALALTQEELDVIVDAVVGRIPTGPPGPTGPAGHVSPAAFGGVSAVALKLPAFWIADPEVWFAQAEAQFASRAPAIVSDDTKYNYVVAALDNTTAAEVRAILLNPPKSNKYDAIRAALFAAFGKTQAAKDKELLSLHGLGDRLPSALLRQMQGLNANANTLFKALFLAQLPSDVRGILATSSTGSPRPGSGPHRGSR